MEKRLFTEFWLSEIDETNIMKTAYTNMVVNGITRLLGIRNLTWPQIANSGIDMSKVVKVEYKKNQTVRR